MGIVTEHKSNLTLAYVLMVLALGGLWSSAVAAAEEQPIILDIRLMGADLIDDMVFSWKQSAPVRGLTGIFLAEINAPVGLDDRFGLLVENRLYELFRQNADLPVYLVHCSVCQKLIAKSTPQGTIISRGIDQPEILQELLKTSTEHLALSLSFEAEERELVLRAHLFELTGEQRVVWASTYSTSASARRILRDASPLISLESARDQQRSLLSGRDNIELTSRLTFSQFNPKSGSTAKILPLPLFEQSIEAVPFPSRDLRMAVTLGFTSIKDSLQGYSAGGHIAKLLMRKTPHIALPDYYFFVGGQYLRLHGPDAVQFAPNTVDALQQLNIKAEPRASVVIWRMGLEVHVKNRLGLMAFMGYAPVLDGQAFVEQSKLIGIPYHLIGMGAVIRW